jgi:L-fucose isomerase-like protein
MKQKPIDNIPAVRLGIVAVSRDCFPLELSQRRRDSVALACREKGLAVETIPTIVENESHLGQVEKELAERKVNALVVFLGNFGPEGPTTLLLHRFAGPAMVVAAAEESGRDLVDGRGDAYCGMLNNSYNLGLRGLSPYIPEYPVGTAPEVATMIAEFVPIARVLLGMRGLKLFAFGPRPQDFYACNAPIKPLFDLGVEVMENSELDLYDVYQRAHDDPAVPAIAAEMAAELGAGNTFPDILPKLAQYEAGLLRFMRDNLGASSHAAFANKCWPAFEKFFGFVPCYVNSRLTGRGIPVACEVDIYGALSEYIAACASLLPTTLLDINNTVPADLFPASHAAASRYTLSDLFMGFHCGNTPGACLAGCSLSYQLIMHRLLEAGRAPDITRGTLEGRIRPGDFTMFRLQAAADTQVRAYVAEGEVLDLDPKSFGGIGVMAVPQMARFYRHVLIGQRYPHHTAIAFSHVGKTLFSVLQMLGIDTQYNQPRTERYPRENPFA